MGENFYAVIPPCPCCGRGGDRVHVGKVSDGWAFTFRSYPPGDPGNFDGCPLEGITTFRRWVDFLADGGREIRSEYGEQISHVAFLRLVESTRGKWTARTAPDYAWGPSPRDVETQDEQGHRFVTREFG